MHCIDKQIYFIEFNGRLVSVESQVAAVSDKIEKLFKDLLTTSVTCVQTNDKNNVNSGLIKTYSVEQSNTDAAVIIKQAEQMVHVQSDGHDVEVANVLMNHIKLDLLSDIDDSLVLHAGLVSYQGQSILLPGNSGRGKSLTTLGLLSLGCHYHTDEVVLQHLDDDRLSVFVRPLMIKQDGIEAARSLLGSEFDRCAIQGISMHSLPIEALHSFFKTVPLNEKIKAQHALRQPPLIQCIVFPCYDAKSQGEILSLSPAQTMIQLFKNNVVARNLPGLGAATLKKLSLQAKGVKLNYAGYHQLPKLFQGIESMMKM